MKILILGAGMYVTGRGGRGNGTILSSLAESSKTFSISEVLILARSSDNCLVVSDAVRRINKELGSSLKVKYKCIEGSISEAVAKESLTSKFDAAIVSTPDHIHFECIEALLTNKIHVLTVKPFVSSLEEANALISLQKNFGLYGAVEFHKRFDESNLYAKKVISSGSIGRLLCSDVDYSQRISIPRDVFSSWADKTNIFQYLGVHYVDLIYYITGFKPVALCAYGMRGILMEQGINTYDSVHAMIEWHDMENENTKLISQFNVGWVDPDSSSAMSDQKIKFIGTKGRIECDQKNRGLQIVNQNDGVQDLNPYFSECLPGVDGHLTFGGYGHKSIEQYIKDVLTIKTSQDRHKTLKYLEDNRPSFSDSLVSTAVIETVNNALLDGPGWRFVNGLS